jgi:hypothetical protein
MKKFLIKLFLIFLPFLLALTIYIIDDPFMVIRKHARYDNSHVALNENLVGWEMYKSEKDSIHFDSFLMGNSCTQAFKCREWEKYLNPNDRAFRWIDNNETLEGLCIKLKALEKDHAELKNVLIILDWDSFNKVELRNGAIHSMPRDISGISEFTYQSKYVQLFIYPSFFIPYMRHKFDNNYTHVGVVDNFDRTRDSITNDAINPYDKIIEKEGEEYWAQRQTEFPARHYRMMDPSISPDAMAKLDTLSNIVKRNKTNLTLVIGPDYWLKQINPKDVAILKKYLGQDNVYDFTGCNNYSAEKHNYYEKGHYRPIVGNDILKRIYSKKALDLNKKALP